MNIGRSLQLPSPTRKLRLAVQNKIGVGNSGSKLYLVKDALPVPEEDATFSGIRNQTARGTAGIL